ncbi:hypothetical protein GCM10025868_08840 [Angustibacter aerolatus]|uniref:Chaperone DnaJ C-terminal domain-containing protein n=1 Tax=Angustibacter aerolatus TaxID=1162965 RepID=A0ABQ6JCY3_9ACTN|nr:DnaJ C-terminal domain-containing protein [Angustibacter aerolatus]GMA85634.1 hypothetical protein GCM10025868_08840 [Angustibacter aerolatus]
MGAGNGPAGDLYVEIVVNEHRRLVRQGDDLHATVVLPMTAAALGTTVHLDTLDGDQPLDIEPGTQPGQTRTLRGLGVTHLRGTGRGDLIVHVEVQVPRGLDDEQRDLLGRLAALRGEERPDGRLENHGGGLFGKAQGRVLRPRVSAPLFLLDAGSLQQAAVGAALVLDGPEGRHAATVRRIGPGERVDVADGSGLVARCTVTAAHDGVLDLRVDVLDDVPEPDPRLVLVQALAKGDRDEPGRRGRHRARRRRGAALAGGPLGGRLAGRPRHEGAPQVAAGGAGRRQAVAPPAGAGRRRAGDGRRAARPGRAGRARGRAARGRRAPAGRARPAGPRRGAAGGRTRGRGVAVRGSTSLVAAGAVAARLGPEVLRSSTAGPAALAVLSARTRWA